MQRNPRRGNPRGFSGNPLRGHRASSVNRNPENGGGNAGTSYNNRGPSGGDNQFYQFPNNWRNRNSQREPNNTNSNNSRGRHLQGARNRNYSTPRKPRIGFHLLEGLLDKDEDLMILEITKITTELAEFLSSTLSEDFVILSIKVFRKVSDASFPDFKRVTFQTCFTEAYSKTVSDFIMSLPSQDEVKKKRNRFFWDDPDQFWTNIIKICDELLHDIPTFAITALGPIIRTLQIYMPLFETVHKMHVSDEIKTKINNLFELLETTASLANAKKLQAQRKPADIEEMAEPPDDYRRIPLYPSSAEILGLKGFLRKNVIEGPYRDAEHYLDVQFRLLREDFVAPLRDGIASHRSPTRKRLENIRIYKTIWFIELVTINENFCVRIKFDFRTNEKKKGINFENSKRFMFGSLLCFTMDGFETIIFGKVGNRDVKDLQNGELIVTFDQNVPLVFNRDYLMVECSVYFEPYYHVLSVLQTMPTINFPMEKYIIRVDSSQSEPPIYLRPTESIIKLHVQSHSFNPLGPWPLLQFYHLNDAQLKAFKAALTQEFTIIQGPPGTGKTYLGLKLAHTLLENHTLWFKRTPMLVICFTNHALDQFLEGIVEFTKEIIRVGGQSKNEKMKQLNLRNYSKFKRDSAFYTYKEKVKNKLEQIAKMNTLIKIIDNFDSIINFDYVKKVIPNCKNTWFNVATHEQFMRWLFEDRNLKNQPSPSYHDKEELDDSESDDDMEGINVNLEHFYDFVIQNTNSITNQFQELTLKSYDVNINSLVLELNELALVDEPTERQQMKRIKLKMEINRTTYNLHYFQARLQEGKQIRNPQPPPPERVHLKNPHAMLGDARWQLYFYWLSLLKVNLREVIEELTIKFRDTFKMYEETRDVEHTRIMKNALVVGMTTTSAARLRHSLQALKCPVVIVEEAAEVLESHIVSSLTSDCQHLILIGDHQQLKPNTADYHLQKKFNFGVSLFERMVLNGIQCHTLNVQHRMRPEISALIAPTIYPDLQNHRSVNDRPEIRGIEKTLFFIDHKHREDSCEDFSKKNLHEASFLILLARHLVLNGYEPEQITILAAYLGQMFEMHKERRKHRDLLENVRISVLDNYQGEESDIILLSLVRSNEENKIGFLKIENRVCVALSRARNGFYIIGNMEQMCHESDLWRNIRKTLETQGSLGTELVLRCQMHRDTITKVSKSADFLPLSEGGCTRKCEAGLVCGHNCLSLCHIRDRDHVEYKCSVMCNKNLCTKNELHVCKKMCFQECGPCLYKEPQDLNCGHNVYLECHIDLETYNCIVWVDVELPCGHRANKPCYRDAETFKCPHPCESIVEPCGHACILTCHLKKDPDHIEYKCRKPCARYRKDCTTKTKEHTCQKCCYEECDPCTTIVRKHRTVCPHVFHVPCNKNVDKLTCTKPCKKILPCGHKCTTQCSEPCTSNCLEKVSKQMPVCGHSQSAFCSLEPNRSLCKSKCPLKLPCGHPCTTKCNEPCTKECQVFVDAKVISPCGHQITRIPCYLTDKSLIQNDPKLLLEHCRNPCTEKLKCGDSCSGSCGECLQGRVHKRCMEKCKTILVCDHECQFPCRQACRPCSKKCAYKCIHCSCQKECGQVCTSCKEKCPRVCPHQKCTKFCGEICDVPPCKEICLDTLKCGHACIGFCGDVCPPKCLVCDKDEVLEVFFGTEDDEGARFVYLNDCGHILESTGLEQWLEQDDDKIGFKVCPRCKTSIKTTQRYSDFVKRAVKDVALVKQLVNGTPEEINNKRKEILKRVAGIDSNRLIRLSVLNRLQPVYNLKRQNFDKIQLNAIASKVQIIERIFNICIKGYKSSPAVDGQVDLIEKILLREEDYITDQEIEDVMRELDRLTRIVEYRRIKDKISVVTEQVSSLERRIELICFGLGKFGRHEDDDLAKLLREYSKVTASGIGISQKEKIEIMTAMGFSIGHWFKCPNGHVYAIGECGGAMQVSKCNECGLQIGGSQHRLLGGNSVATEMDGARRGIWDEAVNDMGNYRLN